MTKILVLAPTIPSSKSGAFVNALNRALREVDDEVECVVIAPGRVKTFETNCFSELRIFRYFPIKAFEVLGKGDTPYQVGKFWPRVMVPFFFMGQLFSTFKIAVKERPSLIIAHWVLPQSISAGIVAALLRIPLVSISHGSDVRLAKKSQFLSALFWLGIFLSKKHFVVSSFLENELAFYIKKLGKSEVLGMGFDPKIFFPPQNAITHPNRLLFVGRLESEKGADIVIDVLLELHSAYPEVTLEYCGSGSLEGFLRSRVATHSLENSVIFHGAVESEVVGSLMRNSFVLLVPSRVTEGLSLCTLEAQASGLPVIASLTGGLTDLIFPGETGFYANNVKDYVQMISYLFQNAEELNRVRENAIQLSKDRQWKTVAGKILVFRKGRDGR